MTELELVVRHGRENGVEAIMRTPTPFAGHAVRSKGGNRHYPQGPVFLGEL
jgi:hypothetical protein